MTPLHSISQSLLPSHADESSHSHGRGSSVAGRVAIAFVLPADVSLNRDDPD